MLSPDQTDGDRWLAGYELRNAHLPALGASTCQSCGGDWECFSYRLGVEMMRAATDGPPPPIP